MGSNDGLPKNQAYSLAENERIRAAALDLLKRRHKDVRSELAKALNVSQPTLSNFLNGKNGAGRGLAKAIALHAGIPLEALVEGRQVVRDAVVRFGDLPGWSDSAHDAMHRLYKGRLPDVAYAGAADFRGLTPPSVIDARTVYNHAKAWWEGRTDEEQSAALHAQAEAEMAAEDAEAEALLGRGKLKDELGRLRDDS